MQTELLSLSKAFTENLFRIPDYQRGYSWGLKQLKEFWGDIEQLPADNNHYTGVLTLECVSRDIYSSWSDDLWIIKSKGFTPYFVVDGQQRLTTAIILVQAISERLSDDDRINYDSREDIKKRFIYLTRDGGISRSYIFGYVKDNPSCEHLKTAIFLEPSDNHSVSEETIYTQNLTAAKTFFEEKLAGCTLDQVEELYTKVTQRLLFNVFVITGGIDVFVTFETMNNRGKALTHLELLKNRLIYISTKCEHAIEDERSRLRKVINESWKSVYHFLGKNRSSRLDDDSFLYTHFILYFNTGLRPGDSDELKLYRYRGEGRYKDFLLDDLFSMRNLVPVDGDEPALTVKVLYEYATDLKSTVEVYYRVSNPADSRYSDDEKIFLERVGRFRADASCLVVASYKIDASSADRLALLVQVERMLFATSFLPWYFNHLDMDELGAYIASGEWTIVEITDLIKKDVDAALGSKEFLERLRVVGKERGYYGWNALRYFLYEYEHHLKMQSRSDRTKIMSWDEFVTEKYETDYVTVEHVYPQRASHQEWQLRFNHLSVQQRNVLKNSVGNLVPLSRPKNSALGNRPFKEKCGGGAAKVGYVYGCYSEIEISQEEDWTPKSILERGVRLLKFMESRWDVPLGSDTDKIKILGLEFVGSSDE